MLSERQLLGQDDSHVRPGADKVALHPDCWLALGQLQREAAAAGFELAVASGFRDFERQRLIWNGKARGERPLHDDHGQPLDALTLPNGQLLHAILRYSALPGASRHHWGTDLDVFDAAALQPGYRLQLSPEEVAPGGVFDAFHCWLDQRIEADEAFGFYRPYGQDRGGVAPERWHLSYAPLAAEYAQACSEQLLRAALEQTELALSELVLEQLPEIYTRYIDCA